MPAAARVGVFGGTFSPPHVGHLRVAEAAREALGLERVLWVPAAVNPHKLGREQEALWASYLQRLEEAGVTRDTPMIRKGATITKKRPH